MGDECLEAFVVMSGKPVNGEAAEAGAYTTQAVFVDKRFFCHFVDGCEVVFHALAAVIAADGFIPLYTEARKTAAVGGYDDIVVASWVPRSTISP